MKNTPVSHTPEDKTAGTATPGHLFIVATPIGNLEDITLRAIRVLGEADLIACEDTRRTQVLTSRYKIGTRLISYHEHNERTRAPELVLLLEQGKRIALVTDAGTPAISDPGAHLVRLSLSRGISVTTIPGPSAVVASIAASGLPADHFRFLGFMPSKRLPRQKLLRSLTEAEETLAFYEAPHRIVEALEDIVETLGDRPVALAREITKLREEFLRGSARDILDQIRGIKIKGEFTMLVGPPTQPDKRRGEELIESGSIRSQIEPLIRNQGLSKREALKHVARSTGISKSELYRRLQAEESSSDG